MAFSSPVLQYPGATSQLGTAQGLGGTQGTGAVQSSVFAFSGDLYQVLQWNATQGHFPGGGGSINVFKSTDAGGTWSILDFANSPLAWDGLGSNGNLGAGIWFDGAHTISVAYTRGNAVDPDPQPIKLRDFNLNTGTWGADHDQGPNVTNVNQLILRADGSYVVIARSSSTLVLQAYVLSALGGSWTSFSLQVLAGSSNFSSAVVYDPTTNAPAGTIHMFGKGSGASIFYQQILAGSIANIQDLTGVIAAQLNGAANPIIVNNLLLWGVTDVSGNFATILIGTGLAAPVFTVMPSPGPFPSQPIPAENAPNNGTLQPVLAFDGTRIGAALCSSFDIFQTQFKVLYSVTTNLADPTMGWADSVAFNDTISQAFVSVQFPTLAFVSGSAYITTLNTLAPGGAGVESTSYFFSNAAGAPLSLSCNNPPSGTVGVPYDHTLLVSGGTGPYTYAITSGALPTGLSLNTATGEITGTPTVAGSFPFSARVTDSLAATVTVNCTISITATLTFSCNNPPSGNVNAGYSHALLASGGVPPYTNYQITAGSLPNGLTLNASTGIISGTPTTVGTFAFTAQVTDTAASTALVNCSITINASLSVRITFRGVKRRPCGPQDAIGPIPVLPPAKSTR